MKNITKTALALGSMLAILGFAAPAQAGPISFSFTAPIATPTLTSLVYNSTNTPGDSVTVQGFGVGVGNQQTMTISDAYLDAYTGAGIAQGIGVCNTASATNGGDGGTASTSAGSPCASTNTQERFNDNVTTDDLLLLTFSTPIAISDLHLTGNGTDGTAFTYWLGNGTDTDLTNATLGTLSSHGFGAAVQVPSLSTGQQDYLINTGSTTQILIAASTLGGTERNLLAAINTDATPVPEPTSIALLGGGLLICANRLRRRIGKKS